jgi:hypothetical protein
MEENMQRLPSKSPPLKQPANLEICLPSYDHCKGPCPSKLGAEDSTLDRCGATGYAFNVLCATKKVCLVGSCENPADNRLMEERGKGKTWILTVCICVFLFTLVFLPRLFAANSKSRIKTEIDAVVKMGIPTTYAELAALEPSAGSDAGAYYKVFSTQFGAMTPDQGIAIATLDGSHPGPAAPINEQAEAAQLVLPLLEPLIQGSKCARWSTPITDPFHSDDQGIADTKKGVRLLCEVAQVHGMTGQHDLALSEIQAAERISTQVGRSPNMIRGLVSVSEEGIAFKALGKTMTANKDDAGYLGKVEQNLTALSPQPNLWNAVCSDFVQESNTYLNLPMSPSESSNTPSPVDKAHGWFREQMDYRWLAVNFTMWHEAFHALPKGTTDWETVSSVFRKVDTKHRGNLGYRTGSSSADTESRVADVWGGQIAKRRIMLTAARLMIEQAKTGKLPTVLPAIGQDAIDPFTGRDLILKPTKSGFKLYSVGPDRKDDGGKSRSWSAPSFDVVYEF